MWVYNYLTKFAQGPTVGFLVLDAYSEEDGSQHVNFIDANGHLNELYRNPAAQWANNDLTALAQGTPAVLLLGHISPLDALCQSLASVNQAKTRKELP